MKLDITLTRLSPAEAVIDYDADDDYELRGRLVGPTCEYTTTVEVAYPVRAGRVVIPEPALWDPETPFLYAGPIELWRDGVRMAEGRVRLGFCQKGFVGGRFLVNGKPVTFCLDSVDEVDEADLRQRRAAGRNTVVVHREQAARAYEIADRIGLFVQTWEQVAVDQLLHPSALIP